MRNSIAQRWWVRLLLRTGPQAPAMALILILSLAGIGFRLLQPWPLKMIVDYSLPGVPLPPAVSFIEHLPGANTQGGALVWLSAGTLVLFLVSWATTVASNYLQIDTGSRLTYSLAGEAFSHLQQLSLRFHNRRPTGDLVKRVAVDTGCIRDLLLNVAVPAVVVVATLFAILTVLWNIDSALALTALVVIPPIAFLVRRNALSLQASHVEYAAMQGETMSVAEQVLSALPIIQAFGREQQATLRFHQSSDNTGRAYLRTISTGLRFRIQVDATLAVGTALLMWIGGRHVLNGQIRLGDLLIFISYLTVLYSPLQTIAYLSTSFASAAAGARRVFEVLESKEHIKELASAKRIRRTPQGTGIGVKFENVGFSYEPGKEVLHGVSLEALPGEIMALVGATGAGKTTIVSLILRLFDPDQGRVLFDGKDVRNYRISSIRENVSIVLQDPFLLPVTIAENIAYGNPRAPRESIVAAAKAAYADEFISKLPEGYDTVVAERGATLSGGQRQRLAIARAFLKDSPILILDEPTSALDAESERLVLDATYRLMEGRTTFIIGHRLATVSRANRIAVLEEGRIVETGTHRDLMDAKSRYCHLYSMQFPGNASRS